MTDSTTQFMNLKKDEYSRFFIKDDSLRNLDYELSISLTRKYKCMSGCKMCVLKPVWMSHEDYWSYAKYTEDHLTPEWEDKFFKFTDNFNSLTTLDDMRYMKRDFPKLFDFYKRYSHEFLLSSISDQSLFYHYPIIMDEIRFQNIYEVSFSDKFLAHNAEKIKTMFEKLNKIYNIKHVKVITGNTEATPKELAIVEDFFRFCEDSDIGTYKHHDFRKEWTEVEGAAHPVYTEGGLSYSLLNTVLFMGFDEIYLQLQDFTAKEWKDFKVCSLDDVQNITDLLPKVLDTKLKIYQHNYDSLNNKEHQYVKYFKHCADTYYVNHDFNFIPLIMLRDYTEIYKSILATGEWMETNLGLLRRGSSTDRIKSIIEVK